MCAGGSAEVCDIRIEEGTTTVHIMPIERLPEALGSETRRLMLTVLPAVHRVMTEDPARKDSGFRMMQLFKRELDTGFLTDLPSESFGQTSI